MNNDKMLCRDEFSIEDSRSCDTVGPGIPMFALDNRSEGSDSSENFGDMIHMNQPSYSLSNDARKNVIKMISDADPQTRVNMGVDDAFPGHLYQTIPPRSGNNSSTLSL